MFCNEKINKFQKLNQYQGRSLLYVAMNGIEYDPADKKEVKEWMIILSMSDDINLKK